jgi:hypothetical protein
MKKSIVVFLCFLLMTNLTCQMAYSANDNLLIGARQWGMGGTGMAVTDLWSVHHNQSALAFLDKPVAGVYYEQRFMVKELSMNAAAAAVPFKVGTFNVVYSRMGYKLYNDSKYGVGFSRKFGPIFSAGIQMNYVSTFIGENYGFRGRFAAEASATAQIIRDLRVAIHVYNPNRSVAAEYNNERIPTIMRLGLNYVFSKKLTANVELEKDLIHKTIFRTGIEYQVVDAFYLRGGISTNPAQNAAGFGVYYKNFRFDLATSFHPQLGVTPHTGLQYVF